MRRRNSTAMIGRVRLKSKRAAFSISAASEGDAKAKEEAIRERDLMVVVEGIVRVFVSFGREIWNLGFGVVVVVWSGSFGSGFAFVEAMIMFAMAAFAFLFSGLLILLFLIKLIFNECVEMVRKSNLIFNICHTI